MLFTAISLCLLGCTSENKEDSTNKATCLADEEIEIKTGTYAYTPWKDTGVEKSFTNEPPITPTERWYFVRTINQENDGSYGKTRIYAQQKRDCFEITNQTTVCTKWDKELRSGHQEIKVGDKTYSLWQTGIGEYPNRKELDDYNIDFAVIHDTYEKDENDNWNLIGENDVSYFNNAFCDDLKIGDTWEQMNRKYILKEWIIIPIQYENQDDELIRFASLNIENYKNNIWNQITPNEFRDFK